MNHRLGLISIILTVVISVLSVLSNLHGVIIYLTILCGISLIVINCLNEMKTKKFFDVKQINKYMYSWITTPGQVLIFSRDMSWVESGSEIYHLLIRKAMNKELTVCLPRAIELTAELKTAGAKIITYENIDYEPKSRFTIVRYNKLDAQIAVGRSKNGGKFFQHIITEYSSADTGILDMATDIIEIVRRSSDK